jgi:DnaJ-class molecular chaperone
MVERGSLASDEDIKKAYKKAALKWHPDRHSGSTEEKKKEAETKFKEIQSAFELLTDPQKKRLYDQGYDEDEIDQKLEMEKQYASGGGGFGGFGGFGGGYHGHGGGRGHYGFH